MSVRRWLFKLATALSLVLCAAISVLYIRSFTLFDEFRSFDSKNTVLWDAVLLRGGVQLGRCVGWQNPYPHYGFSSHQVDGYWLPQGPLDDEWQLMTGSGTRDALEFAGFRYASDLVNEGLPGAPFWSIRIPLWFP